MTDPDAELRAWGPTPGEQAAQPPGDEPTGVMRLPGYSDFQRIAEGGEGVVYRARQDGLDRFVAVKVINVSDPSRVARFRRELEITVRLGRQHPHIVTVIDTGTTADGRPCIVMEYYDNGSLQDRLRERGPLPVEDAAAAGTAVADALAFAHSQGFLHRDVKPQNILVLPTSYVLADFGIARMADAGHTTSLQMVSYRHAAPQTINGGDPSPADDQWSLGSTLFTLLDGAPPFSSDNPDEDTVLSYLERVRATEPRRMRRSDVPPDLAAIIGRCLSKRREDRFPDAGALRAALASVRTGGSWMPALPVDFGPRPAPPPPPEPPAPSTTDTDLTVAGPYSQLAGLTVRINDRPPLPDFGPTPTPYDGGPVPPVSEPPVVAVLPAPTPWRVEPYEDPDPTTTIRRPSPPKKKGRRGLLLGTVAILAGAAIGVFVVPRFLDKDDQATRSPASTHASTRTTTTTTTPLATGDDAAFAPNLDPLDDQGASITLTWADPTNGKAQFVVVDVTDNDHKALATVAPGTNTYTVAGLDPAADQYCFQVIGLGLDDPATQHGASDPACTTR
ncbi:serine/threonine-protein kinase [Actinophytocola sp.]|uniref:serine/threonine-protein kinase n=1 Tax=Actinophytocola sp. TaxID=1872138 RepID=UPI002D4103E1|nr:serine/threonine-protein kinase [Actinophytocola sp.]HYQ65808.1 serine/threonine-protein kinase [Actinophytocola sp.]